MTNYAILSQQIQEKIEKTAKMSYEECERIQREQTEQAIELGLRVFEFCVIDDYKGNYSIQEKIAMGLGVVMSQALSWDIVDVMKGAAYALEDSNCHGEAAYLRARIEG